MTSMPKDPCLWGMSVQQLYEFALEIEPDPCQMWDFAVQMFPSAEDDLPPDGLPERAMHTMYTIVRDYVKPRTLDSELSLAVLLNKESPKRADTFISHSWGECFMFFVLVLCFSLFEKIEHFQTSMEKLKCCFPDRGSMARMLGWRGSVRFPAPETVIWVCALAIAQNADIQGELGSDIMQSPFAVVLSKCRQMIVVYNPDTDLYSRVWCCLEIYLGTQQQDDSEGDFVVQCAGVPPRKFSYECHQSIGRYNSKVWGNGSRDLEDLEWVASIEAALKPYCEEFVAKHPLSVKDAKASVEKDKVDIMTTIDDQVDHVNEVVNRMRTNLLIQSFPVYGM